MRRYDHVRYVGSIKFVKCLINRGGQQYTAMYGSNDRGLASFLTSNGHFSLPVKIRNYSAALYFEAGDSAQIQLSIERAHLLT